MIRGSPCKLHHLSGNTLKSSFGLVTHVTKGEFQRLEAVFGELGNLPLIHLEFEELELDRRELDKQEVEQPEVDRFDLDEPGVVSCGCLRDIFLDIISINIARSGWTSLVGMSTTASNTTFLNLTALTGVGVEIEISYRRSKLHTISFNSATSEEILGVEVLELTLATTGLLREL
ncbi:hypothetical protein Tco_0855834 [Tanacetum coccineum]